MDYRSLSIEKLENLALNGDEEAAKAYAEKLNVTSEKETIDDINSGNLNNTGIGSDILEEPDTKGNTAESKYEEELVISSEKGVYLESLLKSSLLTIKDKMESGDLIAKFAYGIVQSMSDSSEEALNGLKIMSKAMNEMQRMLQSEKLGTQEFISLLLKYAERCKQCYYKFYSFDFGDYYSKEYFNTALIINELDPSNVDLLISCYSEGFGCHKDEDKVIELKERKTRNSDFINCADLAVEFIKRGINIKAIEWIQKSLAADDSNAYPLLTSRFRIWLSEHHQTDEKGNTIDPVKEEQIYVNEKHNPGSQEAYLLFTLADTETEKDRFSKYCNSIDEVKIYVEKRKEEERRVKEEEERIQREEQERIEIELRLKEEQEEKMRILKLKQEEDERKHREELNRIIGITDNPEAYLEALKGEPLFKLAESNKGDPYVQFVFGKIQYEKASNDTEKYNGLSLMVESTEALQEALDDTTNAKTVAAILSSTADKCIDFCKMLQGKNEYESVRAFSNKAFEMYKQAYKLDDDKIDRLIWCYERGIGCERNLEEALQLKKEKAHRGGIIENAEVVIDYKGRGMTVESVLWSQKALSSIDAQMAPKLVAKLRMLIAESGFTDEGGRTIDIEAERARYNEAGSPMSPAEAYILFNLADDESEKLELAEACKSYKNAKDYIIAKKREREELERQAMEEEERRLEQEKEAERREKLKANMQDKAKNIGNLLVIAVVVVVAIALIALLGKIITSSPSTLIKVLAAIIIVLIVVLLTVGRNKKNNK